MTKNILRAQSRGDSRFARVMTTLAMMLIIATSTWAATDKSFTITFKSSSGASDSSSKVSSVEAIVDEGASYVYSVEAENVYNGKSGYGIKLGTSSKTGSLTLTLSEEVKNVTSIVVNAQQYGTNAADQTLKIQGDSYTTTEEFADYTYTYSTPASVTSIALATATKRTYIKSVTVNYTEEEQGGGSTGGDTKYAVALAEGTVDAANWAIAPAEAAEGAKVTATYSGSKHVKSVTAIVKAAEPISLIVNPEVGQVIGADGKNYADAAAATAAGTTAVAMIAYVGSDNGEAAPYNHGLALALSDADGGNYKSWGPLFTDAGHSKQTDSDNFTIESGLQYNATHNTDDYPAFKAAIANNSIAAPTGCSAWFLASGYQWKQMFAGNASNLQTLAGLQSAYYWSSSENSTNNAWYFETDHGWWYDEGKGSFSLVRSCLAF